MRARGFDAAPIAPAIEALALDDYDALFPTAAPVKADSGEPVTGAR